MACIIHPLCLLTVSSHPLHLNKGLGLSYVGTLFYDIYDVYNFQRAGCAYTELPGGETSEGGGKNAMHCRCSSIMKVSVPLDFNLER